MPRVRVALAAFATVWSVAGCLPASVRPSASVGTPVSSAATVTPRADLCEQLTAAFSERAALGQVFGLAIAGNLDEATLQAQAIRERLAAVVEALPDERGLAEPQASLRSLVEGAAELMGAVAEILDDPKAKVVDRDAMLHEGKVLLDSIDVTFQMREPGDTISQACPGLMYTADPVSFPPPPTNEALGLPDTVGALVLEPHVWRIDATMAEILEPLGVDPDAVRGIDVWVSPGGGRMDVYDGVTAPAAALATAIGDRFAPDAARATPAETAGFTLFTFRQPEDDLGSVHVAVRGDRVIVFHGFRDGVVREVLDAMP
jgi:hypothetical protein